ncbi:MAG: hypothetical protein ACK5P7_12930 [Bdellovibrio sp.]
MLSNCSLIFASLALMASPQVWAASEVVNAAIGQVGERVVTSREVLISHFFERWQLAARSKEASAQLPKSDWKITPGTDVFKQASSSFVLECMVDLEAENFVVARVEDEVVQETTKSFLNAVGGSPDWKKLETNTSEVQKMVELKLRAQNFLKFKTESAGVVVTDADTKAYYEKNRLKFGNMPYDQFKNSIREVLSTQILEDRLKDWFEVLRRKYRVRFLGESREI